MPKPRSLAAVVPVPWAARRRAQPLPTCLPTSPSSAPARHARFQADRRRTGSLRTAVFRLPPTCPPRGSRPRSFAPEIFFLRDLRPERNRAAPIVPSGECGWVPRTSRAGEHRAGIWRRNPTPRRPHSAADAAFNAFNLNDDGLGRVGQPKPVRGDATGLATWTYEAVEGRDAFFPESATRTGHSSPGN